jgi:hypothetical protein
MGRHRPSFGKRRIKPGKCVIPTALLDPKPPNSLPEELDV